MAKLTLNKSPEKRDIDGNYSKGELLRRIKELEESELVEVPPQDIRTGKPFKGLFPVKQEVLEGVTRSMKAEGYDRTQPVILWKERDIIIDGHTRKKAATQAEIANIPTLSVSLPDETTAVRYAYSLQLNRRNLTDADLFVLLEGMDLESLPGDTGEKKRERVAKLCGISPTKAQRLLKVIREGPENEKDRIRHGELSVNQAYDELREVRVPHGTPTAAESVNPVKQVENRTNTPQIPSSSPRDAEGYKDTTPTEKTQHKDDKGPMRAIPPTLSEVAIELIREYARTGQSEGTQIDGIQDYTGKLFRGGWIPEDEYQAIQKTIEQVKESGECL